MLQYSVSSTKLLHISSLSKLSVTGLKTFFQSYAVYCIPLKVSQSYTLTFLNKFPLADIHLLHSKVKKKNN